MNLPEKVLGIIANSKNILMAGIGGGYDVFVGLPIAYELGLKSKRATFSNYSFAPLSDNIVIPDVLSDVRVAHPDKYHPEGWLKDCPLVTNRVWQIAKLGAMPVKKAYETIIKECNIDAMILLDGGVDSLMCGDEDGPGTLLEDSVSLAALSDFDIPKILVCTGFGTEIEEELCHYHALENMAKIARDGGFLGSCSLVKDSEEFKYYKNVYEWASLQVGFRPSHITPRIISAVEGEFGTKDFLNPLMGIYWFFDADKVIARNELVPKLKSTNLFTDTRMVYRQHLNVGGITKARTKMPY